MSNVRLDASIGIIWSFITWFLALHAAITFSFLLSMEIASLVSISKIKSFLIVKKILIWTRITPCTFVPNIQNILGLPSPKVRVHRKNCRSVSFFIRPMCLGLFLALACFRFFFFWPCPNLGHKLKLRVAIIFIFWGLSRSVWVHFTFRGGMFMFVFMLLMSML